MNNDDTDQHWVFSDLNYICSSHKVIMEALTKGFDIAQLPNGEIIVTEIKRVDILYTWDQTRRKINRTQALT